MKSAKVLKTLHISRQTLVKYVQNKEIRVVELPNGFYDYNDDDVYRKAGLSNLSMACCLLSSVGRALDFIRRSKV